MCFLETKAYLTDTVFFQCISELRNHFCWHSMVCSIDIKWNFRDIIAKMVGLRQNVIIHEVIRSVCALKNKINF